MGGWVWIAGGCLFVLVAGLFFVLGAAAGASVSYEQFGGLILPLLSTAGSWVAGVGALGAVVVSLWLSDRQRREDVELLKVKPQLSIVTGIEGWLISVDIISAGRRPAVVQSLVITSKDSKMNLHVVNFFHQSRDLPATLSYGEKISLILSSGFDREIARYVSEHCGGKSDSLEVRVSTTLSEFTARLDGNFDWLIKAALGQEQA